MKIWNIVSPFMYTALMLVAFVVIVGSLTGCISTYKVTDEFQNPEKTLVVVTKDTEIRSFFGTNGGADILEICEGPQKVRLFYLEGDFANCKVLKEEHPLYALFHHKQSRGAGAEVVAGAFIGAGLGVSGGTTAAANAAASASNTAIQTISGGKKGRR